MESYYITGLEQKCEYQSFIEVMLQHSQAFSFICFRYKESEKVKKSVKEILTQLKPYKITAKLVDSWPGTFTLNYQDHVYRMCMYKADPGALSVLQKADSLWNWDYPQRPMDLAFYRNGYAWFYSTAHEHINELIIDPERDKHIIQELESIGIALIFDHKTQESELFCEERSIVS